MSLHLSNSHLRVPRGFATLLEGLAREILRDQPEDIPKYAAQYFHKLLKQRQESGVDPVEWAARLEDRYSNNCAFISPETAPENLTLTKATENSNEPQSEDECSPVAEISNLSTLQPNVSEEIDMTESKGEEEEKCDVTDKHISMEVAPPEKESVSRPHDADEQPDEVSDKQKERDSTTTAFDQVDSAANGNDSHSVLDQDKPLHPSESADLMSCGGSDVNLCSQKLNAAGDEPSAQKQTVDTAEEEKNNASEPSQKSLHSVQDAVQFATKPIELQVTTEVVADVGDARVVLPPLAECETQGDNQQEAVDQVETTKERNEAQISSEGGNERSEAGFNSNVKPKEDSLVEISFDDVPEAQQIKEFREKQLEEETSQTNIMEMRAEERADKVAAAASEYRMVGVEKEASSEGVGDQLEAPVMTARVEANDSNLSAVGDKIGEGVASQSSSPRPCSEAKIKEAVNDCTQPNKDATKISDDEDDDDDLEREEPSIPITEEAETPNFIGQGKEDSKTASHEEHNQKIGGNEDSVRDHQTNPDSKEAETHSSEGQGKEDKQTTSNEDPHQDMGDSNDDEEEVWKEEEEEEEEEEADKDDNIPASEGAETLNSIGQGKEDTWTATKEEHHHEISGDDGRNDDDDLQQENKNFPVSEDREVETVDSLRQGKEDIQPPNNEEHHQDIGNGDDDDEDDLEQENANMPSSKEAGILKSMGQGKENTQAAKIEEHHQEFGAGDGNGDDSNPIIPDSEEAETLDSIGQGNKGIPTAKNEAHHQDIGGGDGGDNLQQKDPIIPASEEAQMLDCVTQSIEDTASSEEHPSGTRHQEICSDDDSGSDLEQENPITSEKVETLNSAGQGKEHTGTINDEEHHQEIGENQFSVSHSQSLVTAEDPEGKTLVERERGLPGQSKESPEAAEEARAEDKGSEREAASKGGTSEAHNPSDEGKADSEMQQWADATLGQGGVGPSRPVADQPAADSQEEEGPEPTCDEGAAAQPKGSGSGKQEECSRPQEEEDIMDIPLDDPEANRAAAKIQAGFRGHMTRKKMKPEDKADGEERQEDRGQ